ncbi:MAG: GlsB/YeaQ/YmgE family stress response membrane protein [Ruminiclostridium sp.]
MGILLWLIFGGFVGWIASIITRDNAHMGILGNIIVGLIGSALGGWLASAIGIGTYNKFSLGGLIISVIGAVVLLFLINLVRGKRK